MRVRSHLGAMRRRILCSVYCRWIPLTNRGPIVSFSFDDFPRTAYSTGGAILESFGARGTYYVAPGLIKTSNELGEQFHLEDLHSLIEKGHELGSQTFSHISSRSGSCAAFLEDVEKGRQSLWKMTGTGTANFAYPFGDVTVASKRVLEPVLASCRSIIPGVNGPDVDLNLLRANRLYGDTDKCATIRELIAENAKREGWLIFYTHDVRPQPSIYGCTPALFEAVVSDAVESGSRIVTVGAALAELEVSSERNHAAAYSVASL